jgi:hypothetical protein
VSQESSRPDATQPPWRPAPQAEWQPAPQPPIEFAAGPPAGGGRNLGKVVTGAVVGLVAMAGLAFAAVRLFGALAGTQDVLADKVPARSLVYVTAYLDPGAGQKVNLKSLASKFPALQGRDLGQTVEQGLDFMAAQSGLSFSADIKPWLGSQIALAFEPPTGPEPGFALLIESKDDARARAGMAKVERTQFGAGETWSSDPYEGVDVRVGQSAPGVTDRAYAITDSTVVVSSEVSVVHQVIDTIQGRESSLAHEPAYRETLDGLPKSVLGLAFINISEAMNMELQGGASGGTSVYRPSPTAFAAAAVNQVSNPLGQLRPFKGLGLSLSAQKSGLELDVALDVDRSQLSPQQQAAFSHEPRPADVLRSVPGHAYGVLAISGFKRFVRSFLAQVRQNPEFGNMVGNLDLGGVANELSGQAALEVAPGPTREPAGAVLVGTKDPAGMKRFLDRVAREIARSSTPGKSAGFTITSQVYKGVTIHTAHVASRHGSRIASSYAVANGFGILGTSPGEVEAAIDAPSGASISDAPTFRDAEAQVPQGNSVLYLDIQGLLHALRPQLEKSFGETFSALALPNLEPLKALIATGETAGNVVKSHLFLLIR